MRKHTKNLANLMKKEEKAVMNTEKKYHSKELRAVGKPAKNRRPAPPRKPKEGEPKKSTYGPMHDFVPSPDPWKVAFRSPFNDPPPPASAQPLMFITSGQPTASNEHLTNLKSAGDTALVSLGYGGSHVMETGIPQLDSMLSGLCTNASRMPDPYTSIKTFTTNVFYNSSIVPAFPNAGTTTYGGFCFVLNGSPVKTLKYPSITVGDTTVGINWSGGSYVDAGINNASFISRPLGINASLTFELIGPLHNVICNAMPILPTSLDALAAAPPAYPTTQESGLTTLQSMMGGRSWSVSPGSTVSLCCAPLDNRSWDFEVSNAARSDYAALGQLAWGGWVVWGWGLTAGDKVLFRTTYGEECAYSPGIASLYNYTTEKNPTNPTFAAWVKDYFTTLMDRGFGAMEYTASAAIPILYATLMKRAMGPAHAMPAMPAGVSLGCNMPTNFNYSAPIANRQTLAPYACLAKRDSNKSKEEVKEVPDIEDCTMPTHLSDQTRTVNALTDPPEIVTPRNARRPSLALSLGKKR